MPVLTDYLACALALTRRMLRPVEMHPNQHSLTPSVARALIGDQFPQWRSLPVTAVAGTGTVNAIFRLGDNLAARFPLRGNDPEATLRLIQAEADAAATLLGRSRFPSPQPVAIGQPGAGYKLPWSVQTWLPGLTALDQPPSGSLGFARDLAEFITDVRDIPTDGKVFSGEGRGGVLSAHDDWMQSCFERSQGLLDVPTLRRMWSKMRELPRGCDPDLTSHGDLTPANLLVSPALQLGGVLDVGGLGPADPALDLVCAWHLLNPLSRKVFRECLNPDELQWQRGQAWAFQQSMGLVWYYAESNPPMSQIGQHTLHQLLAE